MEYEKKYMLYTDGVVDINNIIETTCDLYNSKGWVGEITNLIQLNDVLIQIKNNQLEGYYIEWEEYTLYIDKYGDLNNWPEGFYDINTKQLKELAGF